MPEWPSRTLHEDIYESRPSFRWLALTAAMLAWGFDGLEQNIYSIMTRAALKDLLGGHIAGPIDATVGKWFGLSMAMWLWGAAVGGVLFGRLGDRFGRVRGLLLSVTTYAAFTGLSALSAQPLHLIACRFVGAMGLGGTWPLCVALVVETWPENRRAVLAGLIGAASNIGFFLAATYARIMIGYGFTWRWVIGMGFFIGVASLPVIAFVPEPTKWKRSRQQKQRSSLGDLFTPTYLRSTIVGSLLSTVALLGTWGSFLWLATYADQLAEGTVFQRQGKAVISQWQSTGQILGGFLGGVVAGWLGNKRSWCLLCVGAWVTVVGLFGLNTVFSMRLAYMASLAGLFVTGFFGWLPKFLPELYPTRIRASGQGFCYNIGRVLAGLGVLGTGELVRMFHGDYRIGAMTMATIYLFGLVVIAFAPNTGGRMRAEEDEAMTGRAEAEKATGPICRNGPKGASHDLDLSPFPPGETPRGRS
jgi:SHS family sialic acid transporter-like MFS transporter